MPRRRLAAASPVADPIGEASRSISAGLQSAIGQTFRARLQERLMGQRLQQQEKMTLLKDLVMEKLQKERFDQQWGMEMAKERYKRNVQEWNSPKVNFENKVRSSMGVVSAEDSMFGAAFSKARTEAEQMAHIKWGPIDRWDIPLLMKGVAARTASLVPPGSLPKLNVWFGSILHEPAGSEKTGRESKK